MTAYYAGIFDACLMMMNGGKVSNLPIMVGPGYNEFCITTDSGIIITNPRVPHTSTFYCTYKIMQYHKKLSLENIHILVYVCNNFSLIPCMYNDNDLVSDYNNNLQG